MQLPRCRAGHHPLLPAQHPRPKACHLHPYCSSQTADPSPSHVGSRWPTPLGRMTSSLTGTSRQSSGCTRSSEGGGGGQGGGRATGGCPAGRRGGLGSEGRGGFALRGKSSEGRRGCGGWRESEGGGPSCSAAGVSAQAPLRRPEASAGEEKEREKERGKEREKERGKEREKKREARGERAPNSGGLARPTCAPKNPKQPRPGTGCGWPRRTWR
jgi:hypothetical protein